MPLRDRLIKEAWYTKNPREKLDLLARAEALEPAEGDPVLRAIELTVDWGNRIFISKDQGGI